MKGSLIRSWLRKIKLEYFQTQHFSRCFSSDFRNPSGCECFYLLNLFVNRAEFINAWKEEISQYWNQAKLFLKNNYMCFIQQTSAKSEVDQEICLKHSSSSAGWASLRGRSRLCRRWSRRCIRGTWWGRCRWRPPPGLYFNSWGENRGTGG